MKFGAQPDEKQNTRHQGDHLSRGGVLLLAALAGNGLAPGVLTAGQGENGRSHFEHSLLAELSGPLLREGKRMLEMHSIGHSGEEIYYLPTEQFQLIAAQPGYQQEFVARALSGRLELEAVYRMSPGTLTPDLLQTVYEAYNSDAPSPGSPATENVREGKIKEAATVILCAQEGFQHMPVVLEALRSNYFFLNYCAWLALQRAIYPEVGPESSTFEAGGLKDIDPKAESERIRLVSQLEALVREAPSNPTGLQASEVLLRTQYDGRQSRYRIQPSSASLAVEIYLAAAPDSELRAKYEAYLWDACRSADTLPLREEQVLSLLNQGFEPFLVRCAQEFVNGGAQGPGVTEASFTGLPRHTLLTAITNSQSFDRTLLSAINSGDEEAVSALVRLLLADTEHDPTERLILVVENCLALTNTNVFGVVVEEVRKSDWVEPGSDFEREICDRIPKVDSIKQHYLMQLVKSVPDTLNAWVLQQYYTQLDLVDSRETQAYHAFALVARTVKLGRPENAEVVLGALSTQLFVEAPLVYFAETVSWALPQSPELVSFILDMAWRHTPTLSIWEAFPDPDGLYVISMGCGGPSFHDTTPKLVERFTPENIIASNIFELDRSQLSSKERASYIGLLNHIIHSLASREAISSPVVARCMAVYADYENDATYQGERLRAACSNLFSSVLRQGCDEAMIVSTWLQDKYKTGSANFKNDFASIAYLSGDINLAATIANHPPDLNKSLSDLNPTEVEEICVLLNRSHPQAVESLLGWLNEASLTSVAQMPTENFVRLRRFLGAAWNVAGLTSNERLLAQAVRLFVEQSPLAPLSKSEDSRWSKGWAGRHQPLSEALAIVPSDQIVSDLAQEAGRGSSELFQVMTLVHRW